MKQITERTLIPVSLVMVLFSTLIGGILWLSSMYSSISNANDRLNRYDQDMSEVKKDVSEIKRIVYKIDGRLGGR